MFGEMAAMLAEKGLAHEAQVLARYTGAGRVVHEVPERRTGETFTAWVDRVGDVLGHGHEILFQVPLVHDGIRGVADFLERVESPGGAVTYEPVDAKLARHSAKPGHVLQLCFYAEAITALTGRQPEHVHLELGSGRRETIRVDDVLPYWRRLRSRLAALVAEPTAGGHDGRSRVITAGSASSRRCARRSGAPRTPWSTSPASTDPTGAGWSMPASARSPVWRVSTARSRTTTR